MKNEITKRINPSRLTLMVIILLGLVYLWYSLPQMDDYLRLTIIIASALLILILGNSLTNEYIAKPKVN